MTASPSTVPTTGTEQRLLSVKDIANRFGCSTRNVWNLSKAGRLPAPLKLGSLTRWRSADIDALIARLGT